ncbi:hypothetical protein GDO78_020128, partial [Eleutherodactylus coqui]
GLLVPALIALIAGLVIHSFIIGVNVTDWWKGRSVTPVDHIVTSLGISRICTQCAITLYVILDIFFPSSLKFYITLTIIGFFYDLFSYANIWLTTLLSIVFCLKISNFHSRLFLYLRGMIAHRTVYFIVVAVLLSAFSCLITLLISITDVTKEENYNMTVHKKSTNCMYISIIYVFTTRMFFPLLFYCISSVLLFTGLYNHTVKMKMSSNLSINLETYYSVMKYVSFTFIYNTTLFIGHFFSLFYYYVYCVILLWLHIVLNFLPVLHSSYLIYRAPKLRSQMSKGLQNVNNFLFRRKNTETGEDI